MTDEEGRPLDIKNPAHAQQRHNAFKERTELLTQMAESQQRIARVNRDFLSKVLAKLPLDDARSVEKSYQAVAWMYVYPDTADPEPLYLTLLESSRGDEGLREAAQQLWSHYRKAYEDLSAKARTLNEQNEVQVASIGVNDGVTERRAEIAALMWKRVDLNKRIIESITSILPPEKLEANRDAIRAFELQVQRARPPKARYDAGLAPKKKPPENSQP